MYEEVIGTGSWRTLQYEKEKGNLYPTHGLGPVSQYMNLLRSEDTFKTVSKNSTTGAITEVITLGDGPVTLGDENTTLTNATHNGRLIVVPAITANRTITLPSPVAGAHFKFIYGGAAEEAENLIIITPGNTNFFIGAE